MRVVARVTLALSILFGAISPAAATADFYGVVSQGPLEEVDYRRMEAGSVGTLRVAVSWQLGEPAQGDHRWESLDSIVSGVSGRGIKVMPSIAGTPGWVGADPARPPIDSVRQRAAWRRYLRALVERYGPEGSFWDGHQGRPIRAWQIWNEPNFTRFWEPRPSAREYARLVRASSSAIRAADPNARVVLGGLAPVHRGPAPDDYLRRIYAVDGIKRHFDTVAVHPYAATIPRMRHQLDGIRAVMNRARDRRTPVIVSELGWASDGPEDYGLVLGRRGQADMLGRAYRYLSSHRRRWRLREVHWFAWQDAPAPEARCAFCQHSGLFTLDREAKASWRAFKRVAARDR